MDPITPLALVDQGIAVCFPDLDQSNPNAQINLQINYTQNNPLFNWVNCSNNATTLWSQTTQIDPNGTVFLYLSNNNLPIGFYIIKATFYTTNKTLTGDLLIGLYTSIPNITIGCPYSMYPPISLN